MSVGKKWRDGKKVTRDIDKSWNYRVGKGDATAKGHKWFFRAQIKNNHFGNTPMDEEDFTNRISFGKMTALNFWFWD